MAKLATRRDRTNGYSFSSAKGVLLMLARVRIPPGMAWKWKTPCGFSRQRSPAPVTQSLGKGAVAVSFKIEEPRGFKEAWARGRAISVLS